LLYTIEYGSNGQAYLVHANGKGRKMPIIDDVAITDLSPEIQHTIECIQCTKAEIRDRQADIDELNRLQFN
jgi:orotate phosphoribosyltransferase